MGYFFKAIHIIILTGITCFSGCTALTHVDDYEVVESQLEECINADFNRLLSADCKYCRCATCEEKLFQCKKECWAIVTCAVVNRCDRANSLANCVLDRCGRLLTDQESMDQANSLADCVSSCNDQCIEE